MSKLLSAKSKLYAFPIWKEQFFISDVETLSRALLMMFSDESMPVTVPKCSFSAKSNVMVPGPHPTSRRVLSDVRYDSKY